MLKNILFLFSLFLASSLSISLADDTGKLVIPQNITCAKQELQLNGFGH